MSATIGYLGVKGVKWPIDRVTITPERGFHFHAQVDPYHTDLEGEIEVYAHDGTKITESWDTVMLPKGAWADLNYTLTRDQDQEIEREVLKAQKRAAEAKPKRWW